MDFELTIGLKRHSLDMVQIQTKRPGLVYGEEVHWLVENFRL